MASLVDKIIGALQGASTPLTRNDIFDRAHVLDSEINIHIFNTMRDNGKFEKIGEGRGTRYKLAEVIQPKPKKEIPDCRKEIAAFAESKGGIFSFADIDLPDMFSHHVRANLNEMIEQKTVEPIGSKRDRMYRLVSATQGYVEPTEGDRLKPVLDVIWPVLLDIRKGITINTLCERLPNEPKHKIYKAICYLVDENELEQFGEKRGTTFSLPGEGEFGRDQIIEAGANEILDKVMSALSKLKAARPMLLEQTLVVDRTILNEAIDLLVEQGRLRSFGERRSKMVALPDISEDEVDEIRESQRLVIVSVDGFSGRLARTDIRRVAITQKYGEPPFSIREFGTYGGSTEIKHVLSYAEIRAWLLKEMKSDDQEVDKLVGEASAPTGRNRRKS